MKKFLIVVVIVIASIILSACGTSATPVPTPTQTNEVKVGESLIRITEINFGKYLGNRVTDNKDDLGLMGGYKADPGFHYAELIIEVLQGVPAEEAYKWTVKLQDSEGNNYDVIVRGWGVMLGGKNYLNWTFIVPENSNLVKLIFPEGESIDLSLLIKK